MRLRYQTVNLPITLGASGKVINTTNASGRTVLGGTINTNGNILGVGGAGTTTMTGTISGSGGLTKSGAGTFAVNAPTTYTGDTRIGAGTLSVGHQNALQSTTLDMDASDSGSLGFAGGIADATLGGLKGSRGITLTNAGSAAVNLSVGNNNQSTTYSGGLSGAGGLTKIGTGALSLIGTNTYSGTTNILQGSLKVFPTVSPVPGRLYWLDPSNPASLVTSGSSVTGLNDPSGNDRDFTVGGSAPSLATSAFGGLPAVRFAGSSTNNRLDYVGSVNARTVYRQPPRRQRYRPDGIWGWPGNDKSIRLRGSTGWNGNPSSGDGNDFTNSGGGTTYIATASTFDVNTTEYGGYGTAHIIAAYGNMTSRPPDWLRGLRQPVFRGDMGEVLVYGTQTSRRRAPTGRGIPESPSGCWVPGLAGCRRSLPCTSLRPVRSTRPVYSPAAPQPLVRCRDKSAHRSLWALAR